MAREAAVATYDLLTNDDSGAAQRAKLMGKIVGLIGTAEAPSLAGPVAAAHRQRMAAMAMTPAERTRKRKNPQPNQKINATRKMFW